MTPNVHLFLFSQVTVYITENWLNCKEMWVTAHRTHLPNLQNHTTNILESFWKTVKLTVDTSKPLQYTIHRLSECHKTFLNDQDYREQRDEFTTKIDVSGIPREIQRLRDVVTDFAFQHLIDHFKHAAPIDETSYILISSSGREGSTVIKSPRSNVEYTVDAIRGTCSGPFHQSMLLTDHLRDSFLGKKSPKNYSHLDTNTDV